MQQVIFVQNRGTPAGTQKEPLTGGTMPAILTHDFFGKDMLAKDSNIVADSQDAKDAFLLGNQGPDPFFYLAICPSAQKFNRIGSTLHSQAPSRVLAAMAKSLNILEPTELPVGKAYAAGFMCHYTLDRAVHPLVYAQEYALCDAGVPGLSRTDGSKVHAEIERDIDEAVLFDKTGTTVAEYRPYKEVLKCSESALETIGKMYAFVAMTALKEFPPQELFPQAVHCFRAVQRLFYSPTDVLQGVFCGIETKLLGAHYSLYKSMSHRNRPSSSSEFANENRRPWTNPYTQQVSHASFQDIYQSALTTAASNLRAMLNPAFDLAKAQELTRGLNFSGNPVEFARINSYVEVSGA